MSCILVSYSTVLFFSSVKMIMRVTICLYSFEELMTSSCLKGLAYLVDINDFLLVYRSIFVGF